MVCKHGETDQYARQTRVTSYRYAVDTEPTHMLYRPIEWCAKMAEPMIDLLYDRRGVQKRRRRSDKLIWYTDIHVPS